MQVQETRSEGLKRELAVTIPAAQLGQRLDSYLEDMKGKVRLKGFRPGKVPMPHLKKIYGRAAMAEILNEVVGESVKSAVEQRNEKPALQPDIKFDETAFEKVVAGETDLAFSMSYEILPDIDVKQFEGIALDRPVATVSDEELDSELQTIAERNRSFEAKDGAAETGDKVTVDFVGKVDGEPFEGGSAEGVDIVLGQGQLIPGFEDQLVGATAGENRTLNVTFPEDYPAEPLRGKPATFDVAIKAVERPLPVTLDDKLAETLGLETLDALKTALRQQMQSSLDAASRQRVKRALLDKLDEAYTLELPQQLVDSEFDGIWREVKADLERSGKTFADEGTTEADSEAEYRGIAARRVKLGLVLSQIGDSAKVEVTEEEVQRALYDRVRQFPGQEREVLDFYRKNPQAVASLRAPIYEEKVVDYILELITVNDVPTDRAALLASVADEEEHDHAAHDHDHAHGHEPHDHDHHHGHDHDHEH